MEEVWKDVEGYEGRYQVSNLGHVMSLNYKAHGYSKVLTPKKNNKGYLWVELQKNGARKQVLVHRLVACAFLENPLGLSQVNHKDENPQNNQSSNLEWCDAKYNVRYSLELHPERQKRPKRFSVYKRRLDLKVNQYDKNGNFVKQWDNSRDVFVKTGMSDWSISECCRGNRKTAYGFIWQYAS